MISADVSKKERLRLLWQAFSLPHPTVVVSSYQLVANMLSDFSDGKQWDYVVLDEGHIIKNPSTKVAQAMAALNSRHRLLLTGTYSMFRFTLTFIAFYKSTAYNTGT